MKRLLIVNQHCQWITLNEFRMLQGGVWSLARAHFRLSGRVLIGVLFERVSFGVTFERVWFLVRRRLASRSNPFGFSFEHVSCNDRTRPGCGANSSRLCSERVHMRSERAWTKTRYTLCLTGTVYHLPASINLII